MRANHHQEPSQTSTPHWTCPYFFRMALIEQCVQLKANIGLNITSANDREACKVFASHAGIAITAATAWQTNT